MSAAFDRFLARKTHEYGATFDASDLADQFKPYLRSGTRLRVRLSSGRIVTGTIGVTTGWKPVFLLLARAHAMGSSCTLHADDTILAIKTGRTYHPLA